MPKTITYVLNAAKTTGPVLISDGAAGVGYQLGTLGDDGNFTAMASDPSARRSGERPKGVTVPLPSGDTPTTPDELMATVRQALKEAIAQKEGLDLAAGDQILGL